ncbi:3'(2'),5'-bisphosphate nucleotidase CysQ [bacterium]|nr:3'(2'),5'-bisphosphate nucleotidase CysQ [bacterium]
MPYSRELALAIQAAKAAGDIINQYYRAEYTVEHKGADQPVTIADREADAAIKTLLLKTFPDDGWLSEETKDTSDRLSKNRVWIVDPLDGTKEFIAKIPEFAVSIGLVVNHKPVVGVVYNPATGEMFAAEQGKGATCNGKAISVSACSVLDQKTKILASRSETKRGEWKQYENQFSVIETGGMAHKMVTVACGRADGSFSLNPKSEWDFCGGEVILKEAGGKICRLDGSDFTYNNSNPVVDGIVHANQNLFEEIKKLIKINHT